MGFLISLITILLKQIKWKLEDNFIQVLKEKPESKQAVNLSSCLEGKGEERGKKVGHCSRQLHGMCVCGGEL